VQIYDFAELAVPIISRSEFSIPKLDFIIISEYYVSFYSIFLTHPAAHVFFENTRFYFST